jgi:hypothetical protein
MQQCCYSLGTLDTSTSSLAFSISFRSRHSTASRRSAPPSPGTSPAACAASNTNSVPPVSSRSSSFCLSSRISSPDRSSSSSNCFSLSSRAAAYNLETVQVLFDSLAVFVFFVALEIDFDKVDTNLGGEISVDEPQSISMQ